MNHVMTIMANGDISTLWTEAIPLDAIGAMEIARASTIEFSTDKQEWEVKFSNSEEVVYSNKSRAACLAWEVETLQAHMVKDAPKIPAAPELTAAEHNAFSGGRW